MPFRVLSLTMVQNEADIIEYFVRANLRLFDHMVIVLNPSSDGTGRIIDELAGEGLPLTIWRMGRNHYAHGDLMSWFTMRVRDRIRPDYLFVIDADEIVLAEDRAALERALEQIPRDSVGSVSWRTFVPSGDQGLTGFRPDGFRKRLANEFEPTVKNVLRDTTPIDPRCVFRQGQHDVMGDDGRLIVPTPLPGIELAHLPVRSYVQIREKTIAGIMARVVASGTDWRDRNESHQKTTVWGMLRRTPRPKITEIAAGYLNQHHAPLPDLVDDYRLPIVPLKTSDRVTPQSEDELYLQLSERMYYTAFPLPDPAQALRTRLHMLRGSIADGSAAREMKHPGLGGVAECDWPPVEQACNRYQPRRVIEFGCGLGSYLALIAEQGLQVLGVDEHPWSALHHIPREAYCQHDLATDSPDLHGSFDLSLCFGLPQGVPEALRESLVQSLDAMTDKAILVSFAPKRAGGRLAPDKRAEAEWLPALAQTGWPVDVHATVALRFTATLPEFATSLFVLRRGELDDQAALRRLGSIYGNVAVRRSPPRRSVVVGFAGAESSWSLDGKYLVPPVPAYVPNGQPNRSAAWYIRVRRRIMRLRAKFRRSIYGQCG